MNDPRRILVRGPNWVGDAVMTTPALRALRSAHPRAEIVLEGPTPLEPLYRGLPHYTRFAPAPRGVRSLWTRAQELRRSGFDWAVLFPDSVRAATAPFLAGVPKRVGYARDPLRRLMLSQPLPPPRDGSGRRLPIPMVERYLAVTRALGCPDVGDAPELRVTDEDSTAINERLARAGVPASAALLVASPGAAFGPSKRWPPEHFARSCDELARRRNLVPVLMPGPGEGALVREVTARMNERGVVLDDPLPHLGEFKALLARARLLLCNDSGARQIAVALHCPVVAVLGPTDPRHTASQLERQRVMREEGVACSPCHLRVCPTDHRCLTRLAPDRVVTAAEELLG